MQRKKQLRLPEEEPIVIKLAPPLKYLQRSMFNHVRDGLIKQEDGTCIGPRRIMSTAICEGVGLPKQVIEDAYQSAMFDHHYSEQDEA